MEGWSSWEVEPIMITTVSRERSFQKMLRDRGVLACEVLEALPAAVYLTDAAGHLTFYNRAAADLWGWHPDLGSTKWCGSWRLFWLDGTPLAHDRCPMAVAIKQNRQVRGVKAQAERPDGARVPFTPYPTPLRDADGKLIGAINMLVDSSERRSGDAVRHLPPYTRPSRKGDERRANNLLMAILPIAGMIRENESTPRRRSEGHAQALALRLMNEIGYSDARDLPENHG